DFDDSELARELQREGVAAAPVLNVADLLSDPHFQARGTFPRVTHPLGFEETLYGAYVKTTGAQHEILSGPVIGQDNEYVFQKLLGIPEERYRQLVDDQIVF
ncbi:MAG: CoA transferase, partial [Planctomycetota bacterium]